MPSVFRNLIAVAEKGKKPSIGIYSLNSLKHVRQLTVQTEIKAKSFIKIKFSYNDVFLAALSDCPDYIMYYFDWNQSKVESHLQVVLSPETFGLVHEVIQTRAYYAHVFCFTFRARIIAAI